MAHRLHLTMLFLLDAPSFSSALVQPSHPSWHRQQATTTALNQRAFENVISSHYNSDNFDAPPKPQLYRGDQIQKKHKHTLAIFTMPHSASARIANEAILDTAISVTTNRLSVVLRTNTSGLDSRTGEGHSDVSLTQLRRYVGEIYR